MTEKDQKKPKKKKRAYLNDFALQESGSYIYKGNIYRYEGDWKKCRLGLWIRTALLTAAVIAAGTVPSAGMMNTAYVILPYVAQVIVAALFVYAVIRLTDTDGEIREYVYEKTYPRFRPYLFMLFVFSVMPIVGEVIHYIVVPTPERLLYSILFGVLEILAFLISAELNRYTQLMKFEKMKKL